MISSNSRYADDVVTTVDVSGGSRQVILLNPPVASTFNYTAHVVSGAETIDGLAYAYFGDATQWWQIADINPEILDWNNLTPGTTIRIPVI
jgi:Phage Tail Protein X